MILYKLLSMVKNIIRERSVIVGIINILSFSYEKYINLKAMFLRQPLNFRLFMLAHYDFSTFSANVFL